LTCNGIDPEIPSVQEFLDEIFEDYNETIYQLDIGISLRPC